MDRLVADLRDIEATTVIPYGKHDFGTFLGDIDDHSAGCRFAGRLTLLCRFDAVGDGIAQQVFQRRRHAIEHRAVHFTLGTFNPQFDLLAAVFGSLAHDAAQARQQGFEWHHARAHQAFLEFRADPRLLQQQGFMVTCQIVQRRLQVDQIVRRLGQRT